MRCEANLNKASCTRAWCSVLPPRTSHAADPLPRPPLPGAPPRFHANNRKMDYVRRDGWCVGVWVCGQAILKKVGYLLSVVSAVIVFFVALRILGYNIGSLVLTWVSQRRHMF